MEISPVAPKSQPDSKAEPYQKRTWVYWVDAVMELLAALPVLLFLAVMLYAAVKWCAETLYISLSLTLP